MGKTKINKDLLTSFILNNIEDHPKDIIAFTTDEFNVSRQTVYRHVKELVAMDIIETSGEKRIREYRLKNNVTILEFDIDGSWDEESVWQQQVRCLVENLPPNVLDICHYGITEMINNVIDHSDATIMTVMIILNPVKAIFTIRDNGVGIFTKIQKYLNLSNKSHSILELAKGKMTSAPEQHTGEGIFFSSRVFDQFIIQSEDLIYANILNTDILLPDRESSIEGTLVNMTISKTSETTIKNVFGQFTPGIDNDDFGFKKTIVPVKLLQYEGDSLISRSQAKRLISRFDHFLEVVLDFNGVNFIGQAFADEIFRVFCNKFPDTQLHTINTNKDIENMIKHVMAN